MNNLITAVVSDFDGTIIKHGANEPPARFFQVVDAILERDIQFVAASGRQYPNLKRIMSPVADRIGFIAENGALVVWKGKVLHKSVIENTLAAELIGDMKKEADSEILVSGEGTSYIVPNKPEYAYMLEYKVKNIVSILKDFDDLPENPLKISIYYPAGIPEKAENYFRQKYSSRLLVVESGNGWLDFMAKNSGKGPALKILSEKMGVPLEQMVAFGDSENDISMLKAAGIGYAMSSARDNVKEAADMVCDSVEETLWSAFCEE